MHTKITAIFAEHAAPTHCCRADVQQALKPIGAFIARMQRQQAEYRALLMDAETSVDLPDAIRPKLNFLHTTLDATERQMQDLLRVFRELNTSHTQLAAVFADAEADLAAWEKTEARHGSPAA